MTTETFADVSGYKPKRPPFPADINLCSGAGGLALGLAQAGFTSLQFYDRDSSACDTLRHNLRNDSSSLKGCIFEGDLSNVAWVPSGPHVRLLAAGPPCQPFSMGGIRRGHDDERNLFPTILEAVRVLRPQAVLIENVRGLARGPHKLYLEYIIRQLMYPDVSIRNAESWKDHDERLVTHSADRHATPAYTTTWKVLNAADFGVPQVRYRLFIVAMDTNLPHYVFPSITHSKQRLLHEQMTREYWEERGLAPRTTREGPLIGDAQIEDEQPWITVRDAIADLPPASSEEASCWNNHWAIPGARTYNGHTGSLLDWPSKTLKAGVHGVPGGENMVVCDDTSVRYYTLREMARLQSFPNDYYFLGARSTITRQIGNATPRDLAAVVAKPLGDMFSDELLCAAASSATHAPIETAFGRG